MFIIFFVCIVSFLLTKFAHFFFEVGNPAHPHSSFFLHNQTLLRFMSAPAAWSIQRVGLCNVPIH